MEKTIQISGLSKSYDGKKVMRISASQLLRVKCTVCLEQMA